MKLSFRTEEKEISNGQSTIDAFSIINGLDSLITLPKITTEYIDNMKSINKASQNKKEVHKYTKWILCMTYLIPIIHLYILNDKRLNYFIKRSDIDIELRNGQLTYYDVILPEVDLSLSDLKQCGIDNEVADFIGGIISNKSTKEHRIIRKMIQNIFFVVCESERLFDKNGEKMSEKKLTKVTTICWQFKDNDEKKKIQSMILKPKNHLIPQIDTNNLYIKYDPEELISKLLNNDNKHDSCTDKCEINYDHSSIPNKILSLLTSFFGESNNISSIMRVLMFMFVIYICTLNKIIKKILGLDLLQMIADEYGLPEIFKNKLYQKLKFNH